jgi:Zn-dependent peptidase ImmA (M78 family)
LRRFRDQVEIAWSDSPPIGAPDDFAFLVPRGRALVDTELVASALHSVLTAAVDQLRIWNDASVRLDALGKAAKALKRPRLQRAARLDWLFDLGAGERGFGSSWEDLRALFRGAPAKVRRALFEPEGGSGLFLRGSSHAVLLFGCVDPNISHSDARTLAEALIALFDEDGDSEALLDLVAGVAGAGRQGLPWEQGYEVAEETHQLVGPVDDDFVDIENLLTGFGIEIGEVVLEDQRIRGVSIAGAQHRPAILVNPAHPRNGSEEGRRFTLAHELCHLLVDRDVGSKLAVASGPWAPVQIEQRANAFGAYFLMPSERIDGLIADIDRPVSTADIVRHVAQALKTSPRATLEHLHNLGWIDEFERDMLRGTGLALYGSAALD